MLRPPRSRLVTGGALLISGLLAGAGCAEDQMADQTARIELGARTISFDVESCGLEGDSVLLLGRSPAGSVLQAVIGLDGDDEGDPAATGVTLYDDGVDLGAFGAESWTRRQMEAPAPGAIETASLRGSRVQAAGELEELDLEGRPAGFGGGTEFQLDARCDE